MCSIYIREIDTARIPAIIKGAMIYFYGAFKGSYVFYSLSRMQVNKSSGTFCSAIESGVFNF